MSVVPIRDGGLIPAVVAEPDDEAIATLEKMLTDARSGYLRAYAYAVIDRDRGIHHGWVGHADHHDMTAGVNMLAFKYMHDAEHSDHYRED